MSTDRTFQPQRRPPDVEEALSSMLWTPYERSCADSSSDEDDRWDQAKRFRKSNSSYDHSSSHQPLTTTSFAGKYQLCPPVAITKSSLPENLANTLQSTPYVPFSNIFYKNRNNNDASGSHEPNSIKINSNPKMSDPLRHHSCRFSYPYSGTLAGLNKTWVPSTNSTQPPSYESLYETVSVTYDRSTRDDNCYDQHTSRTDMTLNRNAIENPKCKDNLEVSLEKESTPHLLNERNLGIVKLLTTAANVGKESLMNLENNSDNVASSPHDNYGEAGAETLVLLRKTQSVNGRLQQTKEYNSTINNNNKEDNDNDDDYTSGERQHMQSQLTIAGTQVTATQIAGVIDNSTKEIGRAKLISHKGEENR